MEQIQQELAACREYAQQGYALAQENFDKMQDALRGEQKKTSRDGSSTKSN